MDVLSRYALTSALVAEWGCLAVANLCTDSRENALLLGQINCCESKLVIRLILMTLMCNRPPVLVITSILLKFGKIYANVADRYVVVVSLTNLNLKKPF
jgi:hypothetical protein